MVSCASAKQRQTGKVSQSPQGAQEYPKGGFGCYRIAHLNFNDWITYEYLINQCIFGDSCF